MDFSFSVVVVYAIILGLVAPYISAHSDKYGALLPPAIATATGSVIWGALIWVGMPTTDAWIWLAVMLVMPVVMIIVSNRVANSRDKAFEEELKLAQGAR
ncbi:MAG: hypothetical protein RL719_574 [Actinomycetota bacterium]